MTNGVETITTPDAVLYGYRKIVKLAWHSAPIGGIANIADRTGKILAVVSEQHPDLWLNEGLHEGLFFIKGVTAGMLYVYHDGVSSAGG